MSCKKAKFTNTTPCTDDIMNLSGYELTCARVWVFCVVYSICEGASGGRVGFLESASWPQVFEQHKSVLAGPARWRAHIQYVCGPVCTCFDQLSLRAEHGAHTDGKIKAACVN